MTDYKWHCVLSDKRFKSTQAALEHALSTDPSNIYPVYGDSKYARM